MIYRFIFSTGGLKLENYNTGTIGFNVIDKILWGLWMTSSKSTKVSFESTQCHTEYINLGILLDLNVSLAWKN